MNPRASPSPFGVLDFLAWNHPWNHFHYPSLEQIDQSAGLMAQARIAWVRIDFLWSDLEPEKGRFDFSRYDPILEVLRTHRLSVLGILHYNPAWREGPWNQAPDPALYTSYAQAVVSHFKDRVQYWEIWNEPDHPTYWQPQDDLTAYTELLNRVAPAIKEADPTAQILLGALTQNAAQKLPTIYKKTGRNHFDVVNLHPFVNPQAPDGLARIQEQCQNLRAVMDRFRDSEKPIWITEIGCPGMKDPASATPWWMGDNPTETQQADYLERVFIERKR